MATYVIIVLHVFLCTTCQIEEAKSTVWELKKNLLH